MRVRDDRGAVLRSCRRIGDKELELDWREQGAFLKARSAGVPKWALGLDAGLLAWGCVWAGIGFPRIHTAARWAIYVGGLCFWIGAALVARKLAWPARFRGQRAACLGVGVCPACAYAIENAERDEDDCVVCPECGAAWRMRESA